MYKTLTKIAACLVGVQAGLISEEHVTKTLVVLDNWATIESHSVFFSHITDKLGHQVEYAMATTGPNIVKHYDEYYFDNIIFMAPSTKGKSCWLIAQRMRLPLG
jgi:P2-related tail formation protein